MRKSPTIAGLDVGTTKVCALIGEVSSSGVDILGIGQHPSRGLRKGMVVNIDSTVEAIKRAVQEAEQMAGVEVDAVYASIGGGHLTGINSQGVVAVQGRGREVGPADVERALGVARDVPLVPDREILHVLIQAFSIDDQDGIREPLGMLGSRLGVEVHLVTGAVAAAQNVVRSVNRAGLTVRDLVLQPLASAESVLTPDERDLGVVVIDIGGGTTDVALFREGAVWHTAVIPLGGDHITNDIAVGLRAPLADAEELKKVYGCAQTALIFEEETVEVPSIGGRKPRVLSRHTLARIIQARIEEIFTLVARGITQAGLEDAATAGVVVTGGATVMAGVPELAESIFDLPVRRGIPKWVGGLYDRVENPMYATGVGLVLYGARRDRPAGTAFAGPAADGSLPGVGRAVRRVREWVGQLF
ncbi:MAG TPA: cell division protein FtsA [Methylomirabilota bacterium]|jgi:cell division protein FtsA|nr:cell division protein FtsA [Methylomirabilota bacterium]